MKTKQSKRLHQQNKIGNIITKFTLNNHFSKEKQIQYDGSLGVIIKGKTTEGIKRLKTSTKNFPNYGNLFQIKTK